MRLYVQFFNCLLQFCYLACELLCMASLILNKIIALFIA